MYSVFRRWSADFCLTNPDMAGPCTQLHAPPMSASCRGGSILLCKSQHYYPKCHKVLFCVNKNLVPILPLYLTLLGLTEFFWAFQSECFSKTLILAI
jgi:hypothetical protein